MAGRNGVLASKCSFCCQLSPVAQVDLCMKFCCVFSLGGFFFPFLNLYSLFCWHFSRVRALTFHVPLHLFRETASVSHPCLQLQQIPAPNVLLFDQKIFFWFLGVHNFSYLHVKGYSIGTHYLEKVSKQFWLQFVSLSS